MTGLGANSGSREPDPQAVPALSGFDPERIRQRIDALLHPTRGIKRGVIDRCEATKGGPDCDDKLIPVAVRELREVHAVLSAIANQEQPQ